MDGFEELPVDKGYGAYHFNRFRIGFKYDKGQTLGSLADLFMSNFAIYFNAGNKFAQVIDNKEAPSFKQRPTFRFHGYMRVAGTDLGAQHNDWVFIKYKLPGACMTAQTLRRKWSSLSEDGPNGNMGFPAYVGPGLYVNQFHFLAGRRSWAIGPAKSFSVNRDDIGIIETAAVERFSLDLYTKVDSIIDIEKMIPPIWVTQLGNFVRTTPKIQEVAVNENWRKLNGVSFQQITFGDQDYGKLLSSEPYSQSSRVHPFLLPENDQLSDMITSPPPPNLAKTKMTLTR